MRVKRVSIPNRDAAGRAPAARIPYPVKCDSWMVGRDSVKPKLDFLGNSHASTEVGRALRCPPRRPTEKKTLRPLRSCLEQFALSASICGQLRIRLRFAAWSVLARVFLTQRPRAQSAFSFLASWRLGDESPFLSVKSVKSAVQFFCLRLAALRPLSAHYGPARYASG